MPKKLSEIMFEQLDENSTFDDILEVQNQMCLEEGGPITPSDEVMAETERYIAEIKKKNRKRDQAIADSFFKNNQFNFE